MVMLGHEVDTPMRGAPSPRGATGGASSVQTPGLKDLVAEFDGCEELITGLVTDQKADYYSSTCYQKLRNRMAKLDDSVDMRFHPSRTSVRSANDFKSKISMPLVREKFKAFTGMVLASFRQEPIVTILPDGDTPRLNAVVAQEVFDQNLRRTEFRSKAWRQAVQYLGRYGVAVMPMRYKVTGGNAVEKTRYTSMGFEKTAEAAPRRHNVYNYTVSPLNYYQNKGFADPTESDYCGVIERVSLATLMAEYKTDEFVIRRNLREVIERAMKETIDDPRYFRKGEVSDWGRVGLDVTYHYGRLNIRGNEADDTRYYIEMVGDKIIRFGTNPNDEDIVPISVYTCDPRLEYWWGNTPIENSMPMENFLNLLLGMRADQAAQTMERYLFIDSRSGIDVAAMNARKYNGGPVPFDGKSGMRASDIFYEYQPKDYSANSIEPVIREIKEADQRLSFESDFTRNAISGGPQNQTATAAVMMDEKGNTLKSELLENVAYGLTGTARGNMVLLQQMLPDRFLLTPKNAQPLTVFKQHILGYYQYQFHTSLMKNKVTQMQNLLNFITSVVNWRGTGDPTFTQINLGPILKELVKKYDLDMSADEIYTDQPAQVQPQGAGMPGESGAPAPMPGVDMGGAVEQPQMEMAGLNAA